MADNNDNNKPGMLGAFARRLASSFKPAAERADEDIKQNQQETGNQLQKDMQETPDERKKRLMKGFFGQ